MKRKHSLYQLHHSGGLQGAGWAGWAGNDDTKDGQRETDSKKETDQIIVSIAISVLSVDNLPPERLIPRSPISVASPNGRMLKSGRSAAASRARSYASKICNQSNHSNHSDSEDK